MIDLQHVNSNAGVIKIKNSRNQKPHLKSNESQESDQDQIKIELGTSPATRQKSLGRGRRVSMQSEVGIKTSIEKQRSQDESSPKYKKSQQTQQDHQRKNLELHKNEILFKRLEKEYFEAIQLRHKCAIDEIRIDGNDSLRAIILENLLFDIKTKFYTYKKDMQNQEEILNNTALDQQSKLMMMNDHKKFHQVLRKTYNPKSYPIFKHIMEFVVEKENNNEKLLEKIN